MKAALIPSRRKMCSKVRLTEVVPAPEEPVTEMIGYLTDMGCLCSLAYQTASPEKGRTLGGKLRVRMIAFDEVDDIERAKHERRPRMKIRGRDRQDRAHAVRRRAARIFADQRDRIGFIEEPQPSGAVAGAQISRIEKHAAAVEDPI